jgi:HPt (histidine-containing phosphotransfer) domain-containing protein
MVDGFNISIFVAEINPVQMEYTVFNPEYLVNITGGDKATMEEIADIFGSQIPEFVTEMKQLLGQGKFTELGLLAHKAKGSVTVMGMDDTSKMLKEFELLAKAGEQKEKYDGFIARFEADTSRVIAEITDFLSKNR